MSFWENLSEGSVTTLAGVGGEIISGGYKAYQIRKHGKEQASEMRRAAAANAALAREDARSAMLTARELRKKTERDLTVHYDKMDRMIGAQKAGFANAGVVTSAGSAAAVQAETAKQGKINADIIFHNGMTDVRRTRDLAKRYNLMADKYLNEAAFSGYLIESAAATSLGNIFGETLAQAGTDVYKVGTTEGWWRASTKRKEPPKIKAYTEESRWKTWH